MGRAGFSGVSRPDHRRILAMQSVGLKGKKRGIPFPCIQPSWLHSLKGRWEVRQDGESIPTSQSFSKTFFHNVYFSPLYRGIDLIVACSVRLIRSL